MELGENSYPMPGLKIQTGEKKKKRFKLGRDVLGGPMAAILSVLCRGPRFYPWSGN